MKQKPSSRRKRSCNKSVLRLPDLQSGMYRMVGLIENAYFSLSHLLGKAGVESSALSKSEGNLDKRSIALQERPSLSVGIAALLSATLVAGLLFHATLATATGLFSAGIGDWSAIVDRHLVSLAIVPEWPTRRTLAPALSMISLEWKCVGQNNIKVRPLAAAPTESTEPSESGSIRSPQAPRAP